MSNMSWQYIAGFFDGEGHLRVMSQGMQWTIYQSTKNRGMDVLCEIQDFLYENGISSTVYKSATRECDVNLYVTKKASLAILFPKILPYLIVKKVVVQDALRFIKAFPNLLKVNGVLSMLIKEKKPKKSCSIKDCAKPHVARGYCSFHYQRYMNGTPMDQERRYWQ